MSLTHIRTAVDHEQFLKGDVVIVKRTYFDPRGAIGKQLQTLCTDCGELFPTSFRRMGGLGSKRACEVRNIPQCSPCRSKYRKAQAEAKQLVASAIAKATPCAFRVGDRVKCIEGGNCIHLAEGEVYTVTDIDPNGFGSGGPLVALAERPEAGCGSYASRFVKLDRAPDEFRVGDRVRVRNSNCDAHVEGEVYAVTRLKSFREAGHGDSDNYYLYFAQTPEGCGVGRTNAELVAVAA